MYLCVSITIFTKFHKISTSLPYFFTRKVICVWIAKWLLSRPLNPQLVSSSVSSYSSTWIRWRQSWMMMKFIQIKDGIKLYLPKKQVPDKNCKMIIFISITRYDLTRTIHDLRYFFNYKVLKFFCSIFMKLKTQWQSQIKIENLQFLEWFKSLNWIKCNRLILHC